MRVILQSWFTVTGVPFNAATDRLDVVVSVVPHGEASGREAEVLDDRVDACGEG